MLRVNEEIALNTIKYRGSAVLGELTHTHRNVHSLRVIESELLLNSSTSHASATQGARSHRHTGAICKAEIWVGCQGEFSVSRGIVGGGGGELVVRRCALSRDIVGQELERK
jgi:hypothetical protein